MSKQRPPASALLPLLAEAFPRTFFAEPKQVRPLKINIHQDLYAALPAGLSPRQAQRFLWWYVHRPAYQKALLQGQGRIDLTGTVVDSDIPAAIREQARERWQQRPAARAARQSGASGQPDAAGPPQPAPPTRRPAAPALTLNLEDLYAMAIDAKLEVTLKFTTLPNAKPAGPGKRVFALKTPDGQFVTAEVGNKVWNKLTQAAADWPSWVAALTGAMGPRTDQGFSLENPGLQVFEKKAKAADSPALAASASTPAPALPPPPAAPVTVTTGAGPATVTVTKRAPLSLKRDASS